MYYFLFVGVLKKKKEKLWRIFFYSFSVKITLTIRLKDRHYKNFTESIEIFFKSYSFRFSFFVVFLFLLICMQKQKSSKNEKVKFLFLQIYIHTLQSLDSNSISNWISDLTTLAACKIKKKNWNGRGTMRTTTTTTKRTRDKENLNGNVGDEEGKEKRCELQKNCCWGAAHTFEKKNKKPKTFLYQNSFISLPFWLMKYGRIAMRLKETYEELKLQKLKQHQCHGKRDGTKM